MKYKINKILVQSFIFIFTLIFALSPIIVFGKAAPSTSGKASFSDISFMKKSTKAYNVFVTIKGTKKTMLTDKIEVLSYSFGVSTPRDSATGLATGKRMHKPFVITKELDKSSPLLMDLLITNEIVPEVKFSIEDNSSKEAYTITLKNVLVSSIDSSLGLDGGNSATEEISLIYQSISWSWGASNPTVTDTVNN